MKRLLLVIVIGAACVLGQPQPASAGFWDWLEEYSGPGPFKGFTSLFTGCFADHFAFSPVPSRDRASDTSPVPCIYVDKSWFQVDADSIQGYPEVKLSITDFGASLRIADGLDVGAGLGWVAYYGDNLPDNRTLITPIRIVARPIVLLAPKGKRHPLMGAFSLYFKQTYIPGNYTGDDFGQIPPPGVAKFVKNGGELLGSFGVAIDATSLLYKLTDRTP